jgi:hypothetical protein
VLELQWINTNEQLPDQEMRVLLYTPYEIFGNDHACVGDRDAIATCKTRKGCSQVPVFTHWMPLPVMPDSN